MSGFREPPDDEHRCHATSKRTGLRCAKWAVAGGVCQKHGVNGATLAKAERQAEEQRVRELAERIDVGEVPEFASMANAARWLLEKITRRSAQFGVLADRDGGLTYTDRGGTERLRAAVIGEQKWLDSLTKVLGVVVQAEAAHERSSVDREQVIDDVATAVGRGITTVVLRHPEWGPVGEVHGEILGTVRAALVAGTRDPGPGHPHAA